MSYFSFGQSARLGSLVPIGGHAYSAYRVIAAFVSDESLSRLFNQPIDTGVRQNSALSEYEIEAMDGVFLAGSSQA
jgi:hypothetical protein